MRKSFFSLFSLLLFAGVLHAQYIGNVGLQTTQQNLATTVNCTGAAQIFAVKNLGQTQHYASFITQTQPTKFQAEIDGIDAQGNVFRISDVSENAFTPLIAQGNGTLTASGYFPKIQIQVTCSPGTATFSATYSGSQVTFNQPTGTYLNTQIDKVNFNGSAGNVNQTDTFPTPFGSSAGTIYFLYNSPVAGGLLKVTCVGNQYTSTQPALSVTLANVSTQQIFQVPDTPCPSAKVDYTSGGAAVAITSEYVLALPGHYSQRDPCIDGSALKQNFTINAAGATTTQVIAPIASQKIYVCGFLVSQAAAAGSIQWETGTGATCGGSTNNVTPPVPTTANSPFSYGQGGAIVFTAPSGTGLCMVVAGAGAATGVITFVQSP